MLLSKFITVSFKSLKDVLKASRLSTIIICKQLLPSSQSPTLVPRFGILSVPLPCMPPPKLNPGWEELKLTSALNEINSQRHLSSNVFT